MPPLFPATAEARAARDTAASSPPFRMRNAPSLLLPRASAPRERSPHLRAPAAGLPVSRAKRAPPSSPHTRYPNPGSPLGPRLRLRAVLCGQTVSHAKRRRLLLPFRTRNTSGPPPLVPQSARLLSPLLRFAGEPPPPGRARLFPGAAVADAVSGARRGSRRRTRPRRARLRHRSARPAPGNRPGPCFLVSPSSSFPPPTLRRGTRRAAQPEEPRQRR